MKTTHPIAIVLSACPALGLGVGCKNDQTDAPGEPAGAIKGGDEPAGGANAAKVQALKDAWAANADCQRLVACCKAAPGNHAPSLSVICQQVDEWQNFELAVKEYRDVSMQDVQCKNVSDNIVALGNDSNPVPEACRP
jgi:hypothetical protein